MYECHSAVEKYNFIVSSTIYFSIIFIAEDLRKFNSTSFDKYSFTMKVFEHHTHKNTCSLVSNSISVFHGVHGAEIINSYYLLLKLNL